MLSRTAGFGQERTFNQLLPLIFKIERSLADMNKIVGGVIWIAGVLLIVITTFAALIYLFGAVVWMHAPAILLLLFTLALAAPFLGFAWFILRIGRSFYLSQPEESEGTGTSP